MADGVGLGTNGAAPPSASTTESVPPNSYIRAEQRANKGDSKKPGRKPEQKSATNSTGQATKGNEQGRKLQDFDAVQGRPPIRDNRSGDDQSGGKLNAASTSRNTNNGAHRSSRSPNSPAIDQRINEHKAHLKAEQTKLEAERNAILNKMGPNPTEVRKLRYQPDLDRVNVRLAKNAERQAFMEKLTTADPRTGEIPKVLSFDPSGDGKIVVAHGDIENATHVAVMVPGMTTNSDNIGETIDDAAELKRYLDRKDGTNAATVAWLDYDAPDWLSEVRHPDQAEAGGPKLRAFINGMNVREGAEVTLFGHSYGSTVIGAAARGGETLNVDRVVIMGSVGTLGDSVEGMNLPERTKVYSMQNSLDLPSKWGSDVLHGRVPPHDSIGLSGVGIHHTDYFSNTKAMANITLGRTDGMEEDYREELQLRSQRVPIMP